MPDSTSPEPARLGRRSLIKAAGLGVTALGLGAAVPGGAAVAGPRGTPAEKPSRLLLNTVNLYCRTATAVYDGSGNVTIDITVGNFGSVAATGPVSLKVLTPFYANINALPTVAGGTSSWLYENAAPEVPSIIKVAFDGFPANSTKTLTLSCALDAGHPNLPPIGRAIFTTDAANTTDADSDLTRNNWLFTFLGASLAAPTAGNANLYFTVPQKPLVVGGAAESIPFSFYNGAGTLLHGTSHPACFTFTTPFHTRVPSAGRPSGLTALYENDDPAIPSVYQLAVPAGLGALGPLVPTVINIPFQVQNDAPRQLIPATGIIVPTGSDTQGDRSTNSTRFSILSTANAAV
ncbi:hypothetical protein [Kitasatospora purpeofusca]|uniref:hypothetical protein n=1 Tax=Kitasatospora purpeofusca TaxID=67352 RepID=UPI002A5A6ADD|nr:hypothetical protein [Kitasatospora purpeofusca]MDY0811076.1 hypothetical protein [Kitasatospora purpeofusca]